MTDLKLGKKDPKNHAALRLSTLLNSTVVPAYPLAVDWLNIGGWQMLGNDTYGDCVAVTWANFRRLLTRLVGREVYPNQNDVYKIYATQNPGFPVQDEGMDIQTLLEQLQKSGDIVAFAKVDHTNLAEVDAAIAIFGGIWTGIQVTQKNMDQFDAKQMWTYDRTSQVLGGHSIIVGGYDSSTQRFVSWAEEATFTQSFWTHQVDECWVVVWPENLTTVQFQANINLQTLAADFKALTGRDLVIPTPPAPVVTPPAPEPTPAPGPDPLGIDALLWSRVAVWVKKPHYTSATKTIAASLLTWARSKGLT